MPIFELSAEEAVAVRKGNSLAGWGERSGSNRVEPIAKPGFDVPFKLSPGESIFTVGSCFARNVEVELMRRNFHVPMRDLFRRPEFQSMEVGVVNNFGTPSIYNEFAWAFGERAFEEDDHIVELIPGKYVDLHLIPSIRPDTRETVVSRRGAITEAFRLAAECRVMIMTLGLVEVWFDSKTGYYLNATPRPGLIKAEPDRYRLRVLSYQETYEYLEKAIDLLRKHSRPDQQIILTVSPVPLMATYRPMDVMVANTYSKSVLRAAAEAAVSHYPTVTYFPSYELVMLSDRKAAWRDDFVHVTDVVVAVNVGRMIEAFMGADYESDDVRAKIDEGGVEMAVEQAQRAKKMSREVATNFFGTFGSFSATSPEFALEHASFLADTGRWAEALEVIDQHIDPPDNLGLLAVEMLLKLERPEEAIVRIEPLLAKGAKSYGAWHALLRAAMATGKVDSVLSALSRWSLVAPTRAARANALVGRWLFERGELERGLSFLETAVTLDSDDATAGIHLVECLLALGRKTEAREVYARTTPKTPGEILRAERLKQLAG